MKGMACDEMTILMCSTPSWLLRTTSFLSHWSHLAALARAADDELKTLTPVDKAFSHGAGWLERGNGRERLSFREACNKILHAKRVEWELLKSDESPLYKHFYNRLGFVGPKTEYKAPALRLWGEQNGRAWEAQVDVIPFVVCVSDWQAAQYRFD